MSHFARFNKTTGKILSTGLMADEFIDAEHDDRGGILKINEPISDPQNAFLNLETGKIFHVEPPPPPPPTYQELRAPEYPPLTVLADALYWQAQGDDTHMQAWLAACAAVKEKYPKP